MLNEKDIGHIINWNENGLWFLSMVHWWLLIGWAASAVVPAFSEGVLHAAPICVELIVWGVLCYSLKFQHTKLSVANFKLKRQWLKLFIFCVICGIGCNIAHFTLAVLEAQAPCTSSLCNNGAWGFLIAFIVLLGIVIIIEGIELFYVVKYLSHMNKIEIKKK